MQNLRFIRVEMAQQDVNQSELAKKSGLNPNTISAICRGEVVTTATLKKFADALGVTLAQLFAEDSAESPVVQHTRRATDRAAA